MAEFDRFLGTVEIAEALDDFRGVFRGGENGGKLAGGAFAGEAVFGVAEQDFAEAESRAERIIKIVRDPTGHRAEGREALLTWRWVFFNSASAFWRSIVRLRTSDSRVAFCSWILSAPHGIRAITNPQKHFRVIERLRQEISGPGGQRLALGLCGHIRRQDNDREVVVTAEALAELLQHCQAIHVRHHPVGEDELLFLKTRQSVTCICRADDVLTIRALQDALEQADIRLLIVNDEDFRGLDQRLCERVGRGRTIGPGNRGRRASRVGRKRLARWEAPLPLPANRR